MQAAAMKPQLLKLPSAFVPLLLSFAGLAIVLGHAALYGTAHEADEGAAAHVFQILMVSQVPVIAWFAFQWIKKAPGAALRVLALQAGAIGLALAAVYFLT